MLVWGIVVLLAALLAFIRHIKQLRAQTAEKLMSEDTRPPVFYLRSFEQDNVTSSWCQFNSTIDFRIELQTEEETMTRVISRIGPFIAIGKPGDELPALGAARTYVTHADWQLRASDLMSRAKLVVFRFGLTNSGAAPLSIASGQGSWWEIQKATETLRPGQLVFLLAFSTGGEYDSFRIAAQTYFPVPLPEFPRPGLFNRYYEDRINAIMYFEADWTPHIVPLKGKKRGTELATELERLLQPVATSLGVDWPKPITRHHRRVVALVIASLLALFLLPILIVIR